MPKPHCRLSGFFFETEYITTKSFKCIIVNIRFTNLIIKNHCILWKYIVWQSKIYLLLTADYDTDVEDNDDDNGDDDDDTDAAEDNNDATDVE